MKPASQLVEILYLVMGFKPCPLQDYCDFSTITFTVEYNGIRRTLDISRVPLVSFCFSTLCSSNYFLLVIRLSHLNHNIIIYPHTFLIFSFWSVCSVAGGLKWQEGSLRQQFELLCLWCQYSCLEY